MTRFLCRPGAVSAEARLLARVATLALASLVLGLLLFSCAHEQKPPLRDRLLLHMSSVPEKGPSPELLAPQTEASGETAKPPGVDAGGMRELEPLKYQGEPEVKAHQLELPFSKSKRVTVALEEMPLSDFINAVFSDILGVNYVVDPKVKGQKEPVTLKLDQAVTEYQVFQTMVEVLKRYRISVYFKDGVFYVLSEAATTGITLGIGSSVNDIPATVGQILQIIPVRYTDVQNVKTFLPQIADATLTMFTEENILTVKGARDQVEQVIQMVNALDRPAMRGRFVGMVRLKYWRPVEMAEKLREVLTQEGIPVTLEPARKGVYINKLDRWAALLLFAAEKQWLDRAKDWIDLLDVPVEKEERQFFLFFPENSKAVELGASLDKILGGGIVETPSAVRPSAATRALRPGTTPGAGPAATGASVPVRMQGGLESEAAPGKAGLSREASGAVADLRIAVDESRNALIIFTTAERYRPLEALLKKLDVMPAQVLLEATVAEVTLTGSLQYGIEWFLRFNIGDFRTATSTLGGLGLGSGGLNLSVIHDNQKFRAFLNALAEEGLLKIRSSPRLTVRDGKSASITVGTEVPVITSEGTTPDVSAGIVRSVQYRSTGVTLRVTPTIHAPRIVTLEIYQEVSEAQQNPTSTIDSPIIRNSTVTTEVVAADGQTVLLGGLIQENESKNVTKVPLLGDIPLVGPLFRTTSTSSNRSELAVILTPRIIRTPTQMDELRDAVIDSLENFGREEK
jgi:general secretion pathway protein D